MNTFFQMGGYAFYVWMAYGMIAALCALEIILTCGRYKKAKMAAKDHKGAVAARLTEKV
ncbi:MAG: heme exporter protein CcmD [Burkholderiales bacterium]|nr:heme exporter protein CcmD [Burkholderiales bacterium]